MLKTRNLIYLFVLMLVTVSSCNMLEKDNLTNEDIVSGLKKALEIGAETACTDLHKKDGYYADTLVKILLPEEANVISTALENQYVQTTIGPLVERQIDSVILAINRAAENAANDAKPIFITTIKDMSIADGIKILKGSNIFSSSNSTDFDSLAATHFMQYMTRDALLALYEPVINTSLEKDLGLGFSANDAWTTLLASYNGYVVPLVGFEPIKEVKLSEHCANKGLDGLFFFVGNQETKIRKNPYVWASDIIEKVFGSVYQKN